MDCDDRDSRPCNLPQQISRFRHSPSQSAPQWWVYCQPSTWPGPFASLGLFPQSPPSLLSVDRAIFPSLARQLPVGSKAGRLPTQCCRSPARLCALCRVAAGIERSRLRKFPIFCRESRQAPAAIRGDSSTHRMARLERDIPDISAPQPPGMSLSSRVFR